MYAVVHPTYLVDSSSLVSERHRCGQRLTMDRWIVMQDSNREMRASNAISSRV